MYKYELMINIKSAIQSSSDFYIKAIYLYNELLFSFLQMCLCCREEAMDIKLQKKQS